MAGAQIKKQDQREYKRRHYLANKHKYIRRTQWWKKKNREDKEKQETGLFEHIYETALI